MRYQLLFPAHHARHVEYPFVLPIIPITDNIGQLLRSIGQENARVYLHIGDQAATQK